jgi:23S rRNA (cytidine1920-2'-O)/16S rRNA (cytidine1409-2'-O)-methyltransferase
MVKRIRLDQALVNQGLVKDLDQARRLVMAGQILVNGQLLFQPSQMIDKGEKLEIKTSSLYVSRGGEKLAAAFETFPISVNQLICADIGSSTGGFTDCLLQQGAKKVYAIDVGYGLLDWRLRNDKRVIVMERTNIREIADFPEPIDFFSIDVSFISLKRILPLAAKWFNSSGGQGLILIKPQFEAKKQEAAKGAGVIIDPEIHKRILKEVLGFAADNTFQIKGIIRSPLLGPEGNIEFLAWLAYPFDMDQNELIVKNITKLFD